MHEMILFSDHHAHNHKYGARRREYDDGRKATIHNSRLLDSVEVLHEIDEYARQHNISTLVFCGDLFHTRGSVPTDVMNLTHNAIQKMASDGQHLWMIPGNHDFADREGNIHSLEVFKKDYDSEFNIYVHDTPSSCLAGESLQFHFAPYSDDKQTLMEAIDWFDMDPNRANILFAHLGVQGALVGSNYVLVNDSDVSLREVDLSRFDACFFGHFHKHQVLSRNAWYIGATHQHNWGDSGDWRGFLHVKVDDGKVSIKKIETSAPKFVNLVLEDEGDYSNDYVRLHADIESETLREKHFQRLGCPKRFEVVGSGFIEDEVEDEDGGYAFDADVIVPSNLVKFWNTLQGREDKQSALGLELLAEAEERLSK